ncbi:MAG TPA: hypothetical protein VFH44_08540 [Solirubrobacterales bacterium]|nr:hypothetical protein [Solirubrobacterales bacterium]
MADLDRLLDELAADYEAGRDVDPAAFLDRADPGQRQELAARIDSYLMTAPPRKWDPEAYEGSLAQQAVDRVYESIVAESGSWAEVLPALRERAQIRRADLVSRLAAALGFAAGPQVEKVGDYYNRMEHGRLRPAGVSGRVIDALAEILGTEPGRIRAAGGLPGDPGGKGPAFARTAFPNAEFADEETDAPVERRAADEPGRDEIDALFLDG